MEEREYGRGHQAGSYESFFEDTLLSLSLLVLHKMQQLIVNVFIKELQPRHVPEARCLALSPETAVAMAGWCSIRN